MISPITLAGRISRLEPLALSHIDALCDAVADGNLWTLQVTPIPHPSRMQHYVETAIQLQREGAGLAFAIIDIASNRVVGCTRFAQLNLQHARCNIGYTFIAKSYQGTGVNIDAKYLMLQHAFETLALRRVEFITDTLNTASQRAITALGAKPEGLLRSHMVMANGRERDSWVYSIISREWHTVKPHLQARLRRYLTPVPTTLPQPRPVTTCAKADHTTLAYEV